MFKTILEKSDIDELMPQAIEVIKLYGATLRVLQKKLNLGYSASAAIMDRLEKLKIIGEYKGDKQRDILI